MEYYILLKNYDSVEAIKTNNYNKEIEEIIKWFWGGYYNIILVISDPTVIHSTSYLMKSKEEILEDIEWKTTGFYFEEEGEELEEKIRYFKSILAH